MRSVAMMLAIVLSAGSALAADQQAGDLTISQPWSRATPLGAPNGVVYLGITNKGASPDRLVSAATDAAAKAEIHDSGNSMPGMMMMEPVKDGVVVPPGKSVTLKPGGLHIMLMGLKRQLKPGDSFPMTLTFEKAGAVDVTADVGGPGAVKPPKP